MANVISDAYIYTYRNTAKTKKLVRIKTVFSKLRNLNQASNHVNLKDFFSQSNMKGYMYDYLMEIVYKFLLTVVVRNEVIKSIKLIFFKIQVYIFIITK